jgi:hypothetical protein
VGVVAAVIDIGAGAAGAIAGVTFPIAMSRAAMGITTAPIAGTAAHTGSNAGTADTPKALAAEARSTAQADPRYSAAKVRQRMRTTEPKVKAAQPKGMREKAECGRVMWRARGSGEDRARAQRQKRLSQHRLSPSIKMRLESASAPHRVPTAPWRFPIAGLRGLKA